MRDLIPPLAWRGIESFLYGVRLYQPPVARNEMVPSMAARLDGRSYGCPYRESPYYFLWYVVVDQSCGPGQIPC